MVPCRGVEPLLAVLEAASPPRATKLKMVGAEGFELSTSCSQSKRSKPG